MYSLTDHVKGLFQTLPWGVQMTITPTEGDPIVVTDENLVMGSLTVDRYVSTGTGLPVGTAAAGELSFTIENHEGEYDGVTFAGAEINLSFTVTDPSDNNVYTLPFGIYTIDEAPRILATITITALDRMVQFDRSLDGMNDLTIGQIRFSYPCSVDTMVQFLCVLCGVSRTSVIADLANLPNRTGYSINAAPEEDYTARQMLGFCCQILGCNAQFDRLGNLRLLPYSTSTPTVSIDETVRFSSDLLEDITVTGVSVSSTDNNDSMTGEEGYVLEIKDNPLIQHDPNALNVDALVGLTFSPFSAEVMAMPWMDCMDSMIFSKNGENHTVYITKMTQTVNANTAIEGTGKSETRQGYASIDPLTVREQQILRNIRTRASEAVTEAEQNAINFSQIIGNALGLYTNSIDNSDGSTSYYFSDKETLADSSVIYTFNANGFAWTDDWNNGNPTWNGGVASMGAASSAIFTFLQANQISGEWIQAGTIDASQIVVTANSPFSGGNTLSGIIESETASTTATANENAAEINRQAQYIVIGELNGKVSGITQNTTGIAIGQQDGNGNLVPYALFVKDRLSFFDDNQQEVAWISDAELHITRARITHTLSIGGYEIDANYDDANNPGRLTIRWVGVKN